MRKRVPKAHNAIEIEMPVIRSWNPNGSLLPLEPKRVLEVENETKSNILNDSSGCFIRLTRNMISRSSNQYISVSSCSDISLDL